jgi:hypothetical protein
MGVHFVTGLSAFGYITDAHITEFAAWSHGFLAIFY